jgi:U4/U6 small nuclear ribonucleoprotein PRP31
MSLCLRELLSESELTEIREACEQGLELNSIKLRIYEYVESRMSFIAPNLSAIVGASTAAKIMGKYHLIQRGFCLFIFTFH